MCASRTVVALELRKNEIVHGKIAVSFLLSSQKYVIPYGQLLIPGNRSLPVATDSTGDCVG